MAAIDTFDWLVQQVWANPDDETKRLIKERRDFLLGIRSEDERLRYVAEVMQQVREAKKKVA